MEQISILATGGTLMTLGGSTGLGSNLAEVQRESFNELVNFDCKRLSNAVTNCIVKKCVQHLYGEGAEQLVRFDFTEDDNITAKEYLELAKAAKDLGLTVDVQELKKLTKLSFISDAKDLWTPEGD